MKIGLMLGGGGVFGAYQIGVIKALLEEDLLNDVKVIAGTSIGSINAIMLMSEMSIDEMVELWHKMNNEIIYKNEMPFFRNSRKSLVNVGPLYELLTSDLNADKVRNSHIIGYASLTHIKTPSVIDQIGITKHEIVYKKINDADNPFKVAQGSSSVPVLFGSTKVGDSYYVDGGLIDNNPVAPLLKEECNLILAIPLASNFKHLKHKDENITIIDFKNKDLFRRTALVNIIKSVNFAETRITTFMDAGYEYGRKMIDVLKELNIIVDNSFKVDFNEFRYYNLEKLEGDLNGSD